MRSFTILLFLLLSLPAAADEVRVLAAASLSKVLAELAPAFFDETQHRVVFNFGASGTLARQIQAGAPADVFFSADEKWMNELEAKGLLLPESRRAAVGNELVLVSPAGNDGIQSCSDLANPTVRRVAVGNPDLVPAGAYARELLRQRGLWDEIASKTVPLDNVRTVLASLHAGNADAGFVYYSDMVGSQTSVRIIERIPFEEMPVICPVAVLRGAGNPQAAQTLVAFLTGETARSVFAKHGFRRIP